MEYATWTFVRAPVIVTTGYPVDVDTVAVIEAKAIVPTVADDFDTVSRTLWTFHVLALVWVMYDELSMSVISHWSMLMLYVNPVGMG